jgi:hypothetical protein
MGLLRSYYKFKMAKKAFHWIRRKMSQSGGAKAKKRRGVLSR